MPGYEWEQSLAPFQLVNSVAEHRLKPEVLQDWGRRFLSRMSYDERYVQLLETRKPMGDERLVDPLSPECRQHIAAAQVSGSRLEGELGGSRGFAPGASQKDVAPALRVRKGIKQV